jgi:tRNA G18 (ribose-2'-O)-methylase SpoU
MARPTIMTPEVIAKLEEAFAWGCTDVEAALWADIAVQTLYLYQEKNPEFIERKKALKEKPILLARKSVIKQLQRDGKLAMDYLARKKKDEFGTSSDTNINIHLPQPLLGSETRKVIDVVPGDNLDAQTPEAE